MATLVPASLVAALAHDIGKAPTLHQLPYRKADHPPAAVAELKRLFGGYDVTWLPTVLTAILEHHDASPSSFFAGVLKAADGRAREQEMEIVTQGAVRTANWDSWFDVAELLRMIATVVNVIYTERGAYCPAFSHGSVVYVQPRELFRTAQKLAVVHRVVDAELLREENNDTAVARIVSLLGQAGALAARIGADFFFKKYTAVFSDRPSVKMALVPLSIYAFGVKPFVFERRKEGYLRRLVSVVAEPKIRKI